MRPVFKMFFWAKMLVGANVNGGLNVYLGFEAGAAIAIGTGNCAIGARANYLGAAGNHNTFLGSQAGEAMRMQLLTF